MSDCVKELAMPPPEDYNCEDNRLCFLPDEVLLEVFKNLTLGDLIKMAKVSARFDSVTRDGSLWKHVEVDMQTLENHNDMITVMSRHRKHVNSLTIQMTSEGQVELDEKIVGKLTRFRHLGHLCIKGAILTSNFLEKLPHRLKTLRLLRCSMPKYGLDLKPKKLLGFPTLKPKSQLERIHIIDCRGIRFDKPPRMASGEHTRFPCLKTFHLNGTYRNSDTLFLEEAARCRILSTTLEELDISRAYVVKGDGIDADLTQGHDDCLNLAVANMAKYHRLSAFGCCNLRVFRAGERNDVDDETVRLLTYGFKETLEELHLNSCHQLTDEALTYIPELLQLKLLNLSGCEGISAEAVQNIWFQLPNLNIIYSQI